MLLHMLLPTGFIAAAHAVSLSESWNEDDWKDLWDDINEDDWNAPDEDGPNHMCVSSYGRSMLDSPKC